MKPIYFSILLYLGGWLSLHAENTPLSQALHEEREVTIACELTQPPKQSDVPVFTSAKEAERAKGSYHYKLWLPKGYLAEPLRKWPCMFIMSPTGNASMAAMENYLKGHNFIVVMLVEARNGPWEPIVGNFLAAHDDVIQRVRIAEGQKFATGNSGGARGSSLFVQLRPGFAGLVMQAAGTAADDKGNYHVAGLRSNAALRMAITMGDSDKNKVEVERMQKLLPASRLAVFPFPGGHISAPPEIFEKAMTWVTSKSPAGAGTKAGSGSSFDEFFKKK